MNPLAQKTVASPVGRVRLVATDEALVEVHFERDRGGAAEARLVASHPILDRAAAELEAYFRGELREFRTPLSATGTAFQQRTWTALGEIPYGERWSYAQLARRIGRPKAVRAVGAANGRNPISIVTPCHRVIGSNGALTGFAGGLAAKEHLLRLEGSRAKSIGTAA